MCASLALDWYDALRYSDALVKEDIVDEGETNGK